jgi:tRNA threonylcarbamoyladenosine biosynthesis protein TsaE
MVITISSSPTQTQALATKLLPSLKTNLICLYGDLGSGKTTFVQGLAKALKIKQRIISPTFVIVREYKISYQLPVTSYQLLTHIDCYRLKSAADARSFNFEEYWSNSRNLVVVEWAERIRNILPKKRIEIQFKYLSEKKRRIEIN